jgi:hypothetical protein
MSSLEKDDFVVENVVFIIPWHPPNHNASMSNEGSHMNLQVITREMQGTIELKMVIT